jgi:hypothetical protein
VRGDPSGAMPEQVLPILEANPRGAQATPEGVLQVVDAHLRQFSPRFHAVVIMRVIGLPL